MKVIIVLLLLVLQGTEAQIEFTQFYDFGITAPGNTYKDILGSANALTSDATVELGASFAYPSLELTDAEYDEFLNRCSAGFFNDVDKEVTVVGAYKARSSFDEDEDFVFTSGNEDFACSIYYRHDSASSYYDTVISCNWGEALDFASFCNMYVVAPWPGKQITFGWSFYPESSAADAKLVIDSYLKVGSEASQFKRYVGELTFDEYFATADYYNSILIYQEDFYYLGLAKTRLSKDDFDALANIGDLSTIPITCTTCSDAASATCGHQESIVTPFESPRSYTCACKSDEDYYIAADQVAPGNCERITTTGCTLACSLGCKANDLALCYKECPIGYVTTTLFGTFHQCEEPVDPGECSDPDECADPGECADPDGCTDPGECDDPDECTDPGESGGPGEPGECGDPDECTDPGECADPDGCTDPGECDDPDECTDPGESGGPGEPGGPGECGDLDECTDPGECGDLDECTDPGESGEPGGPGECGDLDECTDPGESGEPGGPGECDDPDECADPGESGNPGESGGPGECADPDECTDPGESGNPGESGDPDESGDPGESGDPDKSGNPDEPSDLDPNESKDTSKKSNKTRNILLIVFLGGGGAIILIVVLICCLTRCKQNSSTAITPGNNIDTARPLENEKSARSIDDKIGTPDSGGSVSSPVNV